MNTIYWHMNATKGGVNLLPRANLHPGANWAHAHGLRRDVNLDLKTNGVM